MIPTDSPLLKTEGHAGERTPTWQTARGPSAELMSEDNEQILIYGLTAIGGILVVVLYFDHVQKTNSQALDNESSD